MPAWGILQIHDEKNTTYIIARFDSVLQGISAQNYTTARGKVLLEMSLEGALTCSRLCLTCSRLSKLRLGLYPLLFYKESAFGFGCLFWLHQWGIPRHTCRFYCCLAAHQRTKEKDSAEPLSSILWTPPPHPGESLRRGILAAAVYTNLGSCIQVLSLLASSECCAAFCVWA